EPAARGAGDRGRGGARADRRRRERAAGAARRAGDGRPGAGPAQPRRPAAPPPAAPPRPASPASAAISTRRRASPCWPSASAWPARKKAGSGHAHSLLCAAEAARPSLALGRPADGPAADRRVAPGRPRSDPGEPPAPPRPPRRPGPATPARPSRRPQAWFTYHLYHKAPDWLGPPVSRALGIPYLVAEASHAPKRAGGPWDLGQRAAAAAIAAADAILVLNPTDRDCLLPL